MLEPIMGILKKQKIILASSSPRRKEILSSVGLPFEVCVSQYEEDLDPRKYKCPGDFVVATAYNKVKEVSERLGRNASSPDLIIGADTIVAIDGTILGKPENKEKAITMLERLSGHPHTVYTGVVLNTGSSTIKFYESTQVYFDKLDLDVIKAYVDTGEPLQGVFLSSGREDKADCQDRVNLSQSTLIEMSTTLDSTQLEDKAMEPINLEISQLCLGDKAGGYGIQGIGGSLIEKNRRRLFQRNGTSTPPTM